MVIFKMKTIFEKSSFYKKREKVFSSMENIELKMMIKIKEKGRKKAFQKTTLYKKKINMSKRLYKQDSNTIVLQDQK